MITTLILAAALGGFAGSTPTKMCFNACGERVGCLSVNAVTEAPAERPTSCPKETPSAVDPPVQIEVPSTTQVCIEGVMYFEKTLTPVYHVYIPSSSEPRLKLCQAMGPK